MSGYIGPIPVPQGIQNKETFTATAAQTTFNTNGYTDGAFISVYLNGVRLVNGTDYTATNGSDVVLASGAAASDVVDFESFNSFSLVSQTFDNLTTKNPTHEDTDGGRESAISFKGEQSGGEISTLAAIQASHDGTSDDQKGDLIFKTNDGSDNNAPTERLRIDSDGNIGIGTAEPDTLLRLDATTSGTITSGNNRSGPVIKLHHEGQWESSYGNDPTDADNDFLGGIEFSSGDASTGEGVRAAIRGTVDSYFNTNSLVFETAPSETTGVLERMRIDSSGRVGIGGTPNTNWRNDIANQKVLMLGAEATVFSDGGVTTQLLNNAFINNSDTFLNISTRGASQYLQYQGAHKWYTAASASAGSNINTEMTTPKMTLDISGNLIVGKTSTAFGTAGGTYAAAGNASLVTDGGSPLFLNRLQEGGMIEFYEAGTARGQIDINQDRLLVRGSGSVTGIRFDSGNYTPFFGGGASDNGVDLGFAGGRFKVVFAGTGSINTSDENEKQDIAELTDAEIIAAKAISKLFKTYKWKDVVSSKGDAARTHAGVIAQQVQTAMSDAGLDASKYGFWCSDTWWETKKEIDAVEADEENDIKAQDAYTDTRTYKTEDEAPEGATKRTRMGIRYAELLAFIGAATEQRLTSIESENTAIKARLDALEAE